jgi:L-aspartate oxidase
VREHCRASALLRDTGGRVVGAAVEMGGDVVEILSPAVVLATGGLGGLYATTTNPRQARGEGLALAALAGAEIVDPEFVQFHPTAIDTGADPAPLATEALRGEGARLTDARGHPFMDRYHAAADLAPRDVVARAIATELHNGPVFLDAREAIGAAFAAEFPAVFAACMAAGIDPRLQSIPVKPAAHYHMGGVGTDLLGRTSLEGLLAVGECAATGVHGANRLASNSLLEAAVFGRRAGEAARNIAWSARAVAPYVLAPGLPPSVLADLRSAMSAQAGVIRDAVGLGGLLSWIDAQPSGHAGALPLITARLVVEGALQRRESRGGHFRSDYPSTLASAARTRVGLNDAATRARAA